jgi:hypothetical protein
MVVSIRFRHTVQYTPSKSLSTKSSHYASSEAFAGGRLEREPSCSTLKLGYSYGWRILEISIPRRRVNNGSNIFLSTFLVFTAARTFIQKVGCFDT